MRGLACVCVSLCCGALTRVLLCNCGHGPGRDGSNAHYDEIPAKQNTQYDEIQEGEGADGAYLEVQNTGGVDYDDSDVDL